MTVLGFDTSNYTTSIAAFDGTSGENQSRLLPVKAGELGLRQADALFAHVKSLPDLAGGLFSHVDPQSVAAVGVSTRPRAVDGLSLIHICAAAVRSTAGVLGLLAILAITAAPFLKLGAQYLLLKLTAALGGVGGSENHTALTENFAQAMGLLLATTGTWCLIQLISTVCFMKGVI